MAYKLRLLGRFELVSPTGGQITISSKKNQALIAVLALANGEAVLRSRLCDLLWQDRGEAQARSSLRQAFTALRKKFSALGAFPLIVSEDDAAIDTTLISVDTSILADRGVEDVPGEFLEGWSVPGQAIQDWLLAERQRFSALVVDGLSNRMAELAGGCDHAGLITVAQSLLALDSLNEAAHRALMRGFAETGDRNKALRQYQACCDLLMADLGIEPDAETRKLFEDIRNGATTTDAPPPLPDPGSKQARAVSDKPAITVESFEDLSDGREQPQFANVLTREIITELGHFPTIVVRTAAQAGAARHYVLAGSVQMLARRVRVNVQLNEASSGNQVWGNRYDVELRDSLDLQDELARQIAGNLYQPLMTNATRRARQEPDEDSDEHKLYLQAYHHVERPTAEGMREAQSLLERVLEIDPGYALAYESLAWVNFHSSFNGWTKDPWQGLQAARRDAARGLSLDDRNSYLRSSFGLGETYLGNARRGLMELQEAVSLSPGDAESHTWLGIGLAFTGNLQGAYAAFAEAHRLSPNYHPIFLFRGDALFADNRPREALECYDQFLTVLPEYNWAIAGKAACHVECDEIELAREAVATIRRQSPFMTCDYLHNLLQAKDPEVVGRLLTALETSGLPGRTTAAKPETTQTQAPEFPGIAVLPFENLSGDEEQAYFSDGLTEDITTLLSRFKQLLVIASSSAFAFKGQALPATEVARKLNVSYIVEGSVRRAGGRIRVTTRLVDGKNGNQMWSERYDRELEDIFAVQDDIANTIVGTVRGRVVATVKRRVTQLSPDKLEAHDRILRAFALLDRFTKSENAQAIDLLQTALDLEADNSAALTYKAFGHVMNWMAFWVEDRQGELDLATRLARQAVEIEPGDSGAHWALGEAFQMAQDYDEARRHLTRAVELNPNDIGARSILGFHFSAVGEVELALQEYHEIRRRDPMELNWTPWLRGIANFTARNYGEALASFQQAAIPINEIHFWLAVSYAHDRQKQAAATELQTFLGNARVDMAVFPGVRPDDWREYALATSNYKDPTDIDHLIDGLRKAGLGD